MYLLTYARCSYLLTYAGAHRYVPVRTCRDAVAAVVRQVWVAKIRSTVLICLAPSDIGIRADRVIDNPARLVNIMPWRQGVQARPMELSR